METPFLATGKIDRDRPVDAPTKGSRLTAPPTKGVINASNPCEPPRRPAAKPRRARIINTDTVDAPAAAAGCLPVFLERCFRGCAIFDSRATVATLAAKRPALAICG